MDLLLTGLDMKPFVKGKTSASDITCNYHVPPGFLVTVEPQNDADSPKAYV